MSTAEVKHYPVEGHDANGQQFLYCNCGHRDARCPDWQHYQEAEVQHA